MFKAIPWDVWTAVALALAVALAAIFDPGPSLFIAIYVALCIYVVAETLKGKAS